MKNTLKIAAILMACVFLVSAAGCSAGKKKPFLGVVTPSADHGFTAESIRHGEAETKALAEKHGFDYRYLTAAESAGQSSAVETLLGMKPSVIVLWPVTGNELRSAAQSILDAKVPLIVYDRFIEGLTPDAEISGDNLTIGRGCGDYFNAYFAENIGAGKVNILEFKGDSSTVPMERTNGFLETANPNFNIVQSFVTNWSQQTSMEQMESYLNTKSREEIESIQAIFTHDDEIVLGIAEALKNYRGPAKINIKLVSGVSAGSGFMALFENSGLAGIDFVTWTFSPSMIRNAIDLGYDVISGKTLNKEYKIPTEMVDKNNYKQYMQSEQYKVRYSL
ncbi:MAG: substrate-binding domain-containing protein [Spirochaetaceae bacterium]|jgi:ribose transport system substrate-binding protein|nr:substrate-binding domain-containing protein [Spirochaetaceae bacterium]